MGYNTTMLIMNDFLAAIESDKEFGKKIVDAIRNIKVDKQIYVSNSCVVAETHHADYTRLLAVGGNRVIGLSSVYANGLDDDDVSLRLIREVAEKHGYNLVKKEKAGQ